ncbi:hypothetical protein ACORG1_22970 [Mycobacterium sp. TJFP1]
MTDFNTEHLPRDAVVITPIQAQVGRGYEPTTGADFVSVSVLDRRRGAYTIVLTPALAADLAAALTRMCGTVNQLTHKEDQ